MLQDYLPHAKALGNYLLQDKTIAFKIFELGLKRFGDDPNYVLAYSDHLSHLNGKLGLRVWLGSISTESVLK